VLRDKIRLKAKRFNRRSSSFFLLILQTNQPIAYMILAMHGKHYACFALRDYLELIVIVAAISRTMWH